MESPALRRELSQAGAFSLVIGTIIGTGIFLKTTTMTQLLGSPFVVLAAWAVAGVMSLAGALVYAELGELFPEAGGEYVYLRSGYGRGFAFLYGWQRFWISSPASIAAYAVGATTFLRGIFALGTVASAALSVGFIAAFSSLNCFPVKLGGFAQTVLTLLKLVLVFGLTFALLGFSRAGSWSHLSEPNHGPISLGSFGMAVIAALWAFDGWNNLPMAAGEVKNPERVIPRALVFGVAAVLLAYLAANLAYFYALPLRTIIMAYSPAHPDALPVATLAAQPVFGHWATGLLAAAMVISALGAMNGSILTGARIPYAMAKDGLFFRALARISPLGRVPVASVIAQGFWAAVLALSGSFDQLTDAVVFSSWIFYGLCGFSVVLFRKKRAQATRRYRVPLYPFLPLFFCAFSLTLLATAVTSAPKQSLAGLAIILLGLPFFWIGERARKQP